MPDVPPCPPVAAVGGVSKVQLATNRKAAERGNATQMVFFITSLFSLNLGCRSNCCWRAKSREWSQSEELGRRGYEPQESRPSADTMTSTFYRVNTTPPTRTIAQPRTGRHARTISAAGDDHARLLQFMHACMHTCSTRRSAAARELGPRRAAYRRGCMRFAKVHPTRSPPWTRGAKARPRAPVPWRCLRPESSGFGH